MFLFKACSLRATVLILPILAQILQTLAHFVMPVTDQIECRFSSYIDNACGNLERIVRRTNFHKNEKKSYFMSKVNISLLGKNNLNNYLKLRCLYKNEFLVSYFTVGQSIFLMFRRMLVYVISNKIKSSSHQVLRGRFYRMNFTLIHIHIGTIQK